MHIKHDSLVTEFELDPTEEASALSNPMLLAYLHTKRAVYVQAVVQNHLINGDALEVMELERQRAKISLLTELIGEVLQVQSPEAESNPAA